jgi:hypothetical protein
MYHNVGSAGPAGQVGVAFRLPKVNLFPVHGDTPANGVPCDDVARA